MKLPQYQIDAFTELVAKQLSARGGDLRGALRGDRVLIAGRAVEYLCGEITVDA
jgi:hypothetical protein